MFYGVTERFEPNLHIDGIRRTVAQIRVECAEFVTTFQYFPADTGYAGRGIAVPSEFHRCISKGN